MKSVLEIFIIAAMISFPLSLKSQVKIDLKKQVITIDKNAKANVNKEVAKDQSQSKQNQGTQGKQAPPEKKDAKSDGDKQADIKEQQSMQSYSTYDFIPGDKVILFDDFSQDAIGDFPALWTANAAGEINTLNIAAGKWLNLNSTDGNYFILKSIDFP